MSGRDVESMTYFSEPGHQMNQALQNRQKILSTLASHKADFEQRYGVTKLGIFGSVARGEARAESDVDVVVELKVPSLFKMIHLRDEMETLLKNKVDLIHYRERMNPYLKRRIDQDACYV